LNSSRADVYGGGGVGYSDAAGLIRGGAGHKEQEMYVVFRSGGKQYRATKGGIVRVEKLDAGEGATVELEDVLMIADGDEVRIGTPLLKGGKVSATVRAHGRADKIRIIKHRRRKHYHKEQGHRQYYTELQINEISAD
jgi:large subunit ribosomal protein L21